MWTTFGEILAFLQVKLVGDTGFEPVTSSVSRKRATAAPIARGTVFCEVGTGFEPVYTDLQSVASPLGQPTAGWARDPLRADDEARTRDLNLGKVALYQLSYVRLLPRTRRRSRRREQNHSRCPRDHQFGCGAGSFGPCAPG